MPLYTYEWIRHYLLSSSPLSLCLSQASGTSLEWLYFPPVASLMYCKIEKFGWMMESFAGGREWKAFPVPVHSLGMAQSLVNISAASRYSIKKWIILCWFFLTVEKFAKDHPWQNQGFGINVDMQSFVLLFISIFGLQLFCNSSRGLEISIKSCLNFLLFCQLWS
jgi:hypothetical protein